MFILKNEKFFHLPSSLYQTFSDFGDDSTEQNKDTFLLIGAAINWLSIVTVGLTAKHKNSPNYAKL